MKLSINISLATLLTSSMARASLGKADSKTIDMNSIAEVALGDAFHRHRQISHHKDLILQLSKNKRHLQQEELSACDEAYLDLYLNNAELAAAAETYYVNYVATLESADIGASCLVSGIDIECDFQQTILGQDEFESACTDLGAKVVEFNVDINCDMNIEGSKSSLLMYFTEAIDCIPSECEVDAQSVIAESVVNLDNELESAFLASGASSVECKESHTFNTTEAAP